MGLRDTVRGEVRDNVHVFNLNKWMGSDLIQQVTAGYEKDFRGRAIARFGIVRFVV